IGSRAGPALARPLSETKNYWNLKSVAGYVKSVKVGRNTTLSIYAVKFRYYLEPHYSYRTSNLLRRSVLGRAVRRVRSKKIFGPAQVAFLFSAPLDLVRNRRCLLRDRFCLRLSSSGTPRDNTISKCGIDAPLYCGGSKCRVERVVLSGR